MKKSSRISKEAHTERMGDRAGRRAEDAQTIIANAIQFPRHLSWELERCRDHRRRNGVGRPPRRAT